jgi:hypothetical protein
VQIFYLPKDFSPESFSVEIQRHCRLILSFAGFAEPREHVDAGGIYVLP